MKVSKNRLLGLLNKAEVSRNGDNIYADCPKCGFHEFGISLVKDDHPFQCWRKKKCGWSGNIYTLFEYFDVEYDKTYNVDKIDLNLIEKKEVKEDMIAKPVKKPISWQRLMDNDYLNGRGFTPRDYRKYEVGKMLLHPDYVFFAVYQNKQFMGYVGRLIIEDKNKPKYRNSVTDFDKLLYGIDGIIKGVTKTVILVEGVFDKVAIDRKLGLGDNIVDWGCVATYGGHVTKPQLKLLEEKEVELLYLMHESDILNIVKQRAIEMNDIIETKVCYVPEDEDPDTLETNQILSILENAEDPINFNVNYVRKL